MPYAGGWFVTALADLAETLAVYGVEEGFPAKRTELAGRLLSEGLRVADLELLGDHCRRTVSDGDGAAARVLAGLLRRQAAYQERLADLRQVAAARARRAHRPPGDKPVVPAPLPGEDPVEWAARRRATMAFCMVVADRRPAADVAGELGVTAQELEQLVEQGRELRQARAL